VSDGKGGYHLIVALRLLQHTRKGEQVNAAPALLKRFDVLLQPFLRVYDLDGVKGIRPQGLTNLICLRKE
jgi:hypothetical protein